MAYHPLSNEDGLSLEDRLERCQELVDKISPFMSQLSAKEQSFIEQMDGEIGFATPKQLFWLRDIWDRLC